MRVKKYAMAAFCAAALAVTISPASAANGTVVEPVHSYDAGNGELPEGLEIDSRGVTYVSLIDGTLQRIAPNGTT
ncbi:hypothetical protein GTY86_36885, partial [Streptomyces sp. SID5770]|uniref:hypothetical protein n=1 Tax=Streptomyces sp. SID5770 TaxID=2690308 RepID=UPI00137D7B2B